MSEDNEQGETPKTERAFDVFAVRSDKDGKGRFRKVGAAFAHRDGKGYDIDMTASRSNGGLTLRTPQERLAAKRDAARGNDSPSRERE